MPPKNNNAVSEILKTYTDPIPDELIQAFKAGRCVLFVGSGASRRCLTRNRRPLPTWQELLNSLLSWANDKALIEPDIFKELSDLIDQNKHLMVSQELFDILGPKTVQGLLDEFLDPDGIVPSRLHELIVATPFRFYITTNYDNLLERSFVGVWNRHIERVCLDEIDRLNSLLQSGSEFILKLHGDLDRPETIVLGQRHYQFLLQNSEYSNVLESIFRDYSVLMLGYGLADIDVQLTLDRLAHTNNSHLPHFLLCVRGSRTRTEKKRLAADRNVHLIEYVDYFGFHNHLDTFLEGVNVALGSDKNLKRIRLNLRARIHVHYPPSLTEDGLFVWNLLFREGAITLSKEPQQEQLRYLEQSILGGLQALDYLLFVVDVKALDKKNEFLSIIKRAINSASSDGVQILFLVVGADNRPAFLTQGINVPTFYVEKGFSEKDLILLRSYIAQDIRMGYRQP